MDPWGPPWQPQPRGRHVAQMESQDRVQWGEGFYRPRPQSRHNGERYYHQQQDLQIVPPLWQDPRMGYCPPGYPGRAGDQIRPDLRAENYEKSYLARPYSRQGYGDPYWSYPSPSSGDDHAYRGYHRPLQVLQHDRDPRQEDPYGQHMNYWDQNYYRDPRHDQDTSPFGQNDAAQYQRVCRSASPSRRQCCWNRDQTFPVPTAPASLFPQLPAPQELSRLVHYKESGLSSSSYELSQYMCDSPGQYDADPTQTWSPVQADEDSQSTPHHVAPQKYPLPHVPVCFGAGGQLVRVCPNSPADGQPALVEMHSLEVILYDTKEQEEMRTFPGPLVREDLHKVDVMTFCQRRVATSCVSETQRGRDSALLWKLLVLLCRQNGSMVGSDTAELLMQDCKRREKYKRQDPVSNLINLTDEEWPVQGSGTPDLLTGEIPPSMETPAQKVEKFTKLLFYGRKKEALDWAMRSQLWGHALFLSSKMDLRTYSWVLTGFTSTLALNDPLQTLFQLMSGRIPQAALCCGDARWGDWRPHLAVMLSNQVGDTELNHRAIVAMGDTLAGRGLIEAAHFCFLMANVPFGHYGVKTDRMALLGSDPSQPFARFATTESILRMEIFEYCQTLRHPKSFIPSFQVYKLLYASRLADYGLTSQALHYCEGIGTALLDQTQARHPVLLDQVIKLAEQLKLSDPLLLERPEREQNLEPDWLIQLRALGQQWEKEGDLPDSPSAQPACSTAGGSAAERDLHHEFAQIPGYQQNPGHQPYDPTAAERTGQSQPGLQANVSFPPDAHSRAAGESGEGGAVRPPGYALPFGGQKNLPEQQVRAVRVRGARCHNAPDEGRQTPFSSLPPKCNPLCPSCPLATRPAHPGQGGPAAAERPSREGAEQEEAKRDRPGPASATAAPGSQCRGAGNHGYISSHRSWAIETAVPAPVPLLSPPAAGASPSSPHPHPPGLLPAAPGPFSSSPAADEAKGSRGPDGRESEGNRGMGDRSDSSFVGGFSGSEDDSRDFVSGPGGLLAPSGGQVPLFNPALGPQFSTAVSLGRGQPKRLSQRRYPTQP
uniref:Protein transport protein sec16 n=1 Tax=Pelodiscus sinensis TaxID=13735 RepID=K7FZE5_PELSI